MLRPNLPSIRILCSDVDSGTAPNDSALLSKGGNVVSNRSTCHLFGSLAPRWYFVPGVLLRLIVGIDFHR